MKNVEWLLFDFGGCLDSDGVHSRSLFFNQFKKFNIIDDSEESYLLFQEAYTYSDSTLIQKSIVTNSELAQMNEKMCLFIALKLKIRDALKLSQVSKSITDIQTYYLKRNKKLLTELKKVYRLGMVSNFTGNLESILNEYSLRNDFQFVLDSYHVGISKPDARIFKNAILQCQTAPDNICFIGDSEERDITPAKELGMKTILISASKKKTAADYMVTSLEELLLLAQNK